MNHESAPPPRRLSYDFLREITDGFSEDRELGRGTYGRVYLGLNKDGEKMAVKVLKEMPSRDDNDKLFDKEFYNLTCLQHPNIVRLVGFCHETHRECALYNGKTILADVTKRALCFEYMHNGSLDKFLSEESIGHDWHTCYAIIKGICMGLKYLHQELKPPILHLDLKPANVLLGEDMVPRIADFGLSRLWGEERTYMTASFIGTLGYLPPEFINHQIISNKLDIFSLGVVVIKIITGPKGFFRSDEMLFQEFIDHVLANWRNRLKATSVDGLEPYCKQVKRCIEIALSCVEHDRHKRPTIEDIINELNKTETMNQFPNALRNDPGSSRVQESEEGHITKVEENCEIERLNGTGNLFGEVVDDYKFDQMVRYMGRPKTKEDRVREALILVNKDYKDINASRMDGNTNGTSGSSCKSCGPLTYFYIPDYILKPESEQIIGDYAPCCPVVVFINSRSGGQLGSRLIKTYRELLNEAQVFDLSEESPDKVLHRLYANFEKLKSDGDIFALEIERKLRLIVAGGDGTAGWLLGVVSDLKLSHPPPVATLPLGTENNIPFSFGWGQNNLATDQEAAKSFLGLVKGAAEMTVDSWHIIMRMQVPQEGPCDPIAPVELPQSLHAFHCVSGSDLLNVEGYHTFRGGFWNYFSMGMDAQVYYGFHSERKKNPELRNQGTYAKIGLKQGWFAPSLSHPSSRNIAQLVKVKIMKRPGGVWEELKIPSSIRSIICLNLPSFSGGFNPWGTPGTRKPQDKELTAPYVDDGLIEVVGFRDAWHGLLLLAPNGHGTRLAQAHRIRFEFHKGPADHTFMMVDGEPWKQPLPKYDGTVVIEISRLRQVTMLANQPCRSKSVDDPTTPSLHGHDNDDSDSMEDEDEWQEGRKRFGAADTFKVAS